MRINEPITEEEHANADEEHRQLVERQRKYLLELADRVEKGEPLNRFDTKFVVLALQNLAKTISPIRKRRVGRPDKLRDEVRLKYAIMRTHDGLSKNAAIEKIAEIHGVSITSVRKKLGMIGNGPEREIAKAETNQAFFMIGGDPET